MSTQAASSDRIRDEWDDIATAFDRFVTPEAIRFGTEMLRRLDVGRGARFLDVAAGSGALSVPAARLGADVIAVDIAPVMVERLKVRAGVEGLSNLEALVMDGEHLKFPDETFDMSVSQNGVSLFPDFAAGLREMVRVTKRTGRVAISAFGAPLKAEFLTFFVAALRAVIPGFTPFPLNPPPLPFQVADPKTLHRHLVDAGLINVQVDTARWDLHFESARHLWDLVTSSNPIGAQWVAELSAEEQTAVQRVLDGMLRERSGGAPRAVLNVEMNVGIGTKSIGG